MLDSRIVVLDPRCGLQRRFVSDCRIDIWGLKADADIGIHPHEIGHLQPLQLDIEVRCALPESDDIRNALDYERITALAKDLAQHRTGLIETFARRLAEGILEDPLAQSAAVTVRKPQALSRGIAGCRVGLARS